VSVAVSVIVPLFPSICMFPEKRSPTYAVMAEARLGRRCSGHGEKRNDINASFMEPPICRLDPQRQVRSGRRVCRPTPRILAAKRKETSMTREAGASFDADLAVRRQECNARSRPH
jgi:hypothetical protein